MLLLLLRHALTPITGKKLTGWLPGISLSKEGEAQSRRVAELLADVPIDAVYSSPLERCQQTVGFVAESKGLRVTIEERIGEIKYGDWQGKSLKVLYRTKDWQRLKARPADFRFPSGETIREAQVRGMDAIEELRKTHKNQIVLVCSHADMIRVLVAGYLGLPLDLYDRITIATASVTAMLVGDGTPRLLKLGETGSFDEVVARAASLKQKAKSR